MTELLIISWSGCRAELACLHYLEGDGLDEKRPTALCRACSRAVAKRTMLRAKAARARVRGARK